MNHAGAFAAVLVATVLAIRWLTGARWTWRVPRMAIVSWQALGLAFGLALIGLPLALGVADAGAPVPAVVAMMTDLSAGRPPAEPVLLRLLAVAVGVAVAARLLTVTGASLLRVLRVRRRHRELLTLVGRADPAAPGALVLDHPAAAAYCLPGLRPTVVVSAGALSLLSRSELEAVLAHERAHATERHDLVLLPFSALCRAMPPWPWLRRACDTVALLVEMVADDRALRRHADGSLAAALHRFATAPAVRTPAGALALADEGLQARVQRLVDHARTPWLRGIATVTVCVTLAVTPLVLMFVG